MTDLGAAVRAVGDVMLEAGVITQDQRMAMETVLHEKILQEREQMMKMWNEMREEYSKRSWWYRLWHPWI